MSQTVAALIPAAVDYERTLILAVEVSNKSWVLAAQVPGLPHTKAKRTIDPEAEALLAAIAAYRARAHPHRPRREPAPSSTRAARLAAKREVSVAATPNQCRQTLRGASDDPPARWKAG